MGDELHRPVYLPRACAFLRGALGPLHDQSLAGSPCFGEADEKWAGFSNIRGSPEPKLDRVKGWSGGNVGLTGPRTPARPTSLSLPIQILNSSDSLRFFVLFCLGLFALGRSLVYSRNLIGPLISMHYFYKQKNPMYFIKLDTLPNKK